MAVVGWCIEIRTGPGKMDSSSGVKGSCQLFEENHD